MQFKHFLAFILIFSSLTSQAAEQCQALFGTKPYRNDKAIGEQIYKRELQELGDAFSAIQHLSWSDQVNKLVADDSRKLFFHLRVLSQTYGVKNSKFFSEREKKFKNLEFLLGRVQLNQDLKQRLFKMNEPELAQVFQARETEASLELKKGLKKLGMLEDPVKTTEKMQKEIEKFNWDSAKKDRKFLLSETISFAKALNESITEQKFDSADLEKGLHRLRRRMRELIYRMVNLDGAIKLVSEDELPKELETWFADLKTHNPDIFVSAYLPKRKSGLESPIVVGHKSLALLAQVVTEIGLAKDKDEPLFYIESAIADEELDLKVKMRAMKKLEKMKSEMVDAQVVAQNYQKQIRDTHLLEFMSRFLEAHNR